MHKNVVFCELLICFLIHDAAVGTTVTFQDKLLDLFMVLTGCNVHISKELVVDLRSYRSDDFGSLYGHNIPVTTRIRVLIYSLHIIILLALKAVESKISNFMTVWHLKLNAKQ